jgi:AraC-like DNA-binding protein
VSAGPIAGLAEWPAKKKTRMSQAHRIHWEDAYRVIEPQISAAGEHVWPFDRSFPLDVRYLAFQGKSSIALNRHDYYELLYLHTGEVVCQVQDQFVRIREGDLFVMGSVLFHRICEYKTARVRAMVLYFMPDLVRQDDSAGNSLEYLMPFLVQQADFPHVVPASSGVPAQVFDLMKRVQVELPAALPRAQLSIKTYLKMMLVLLVNHYAAYRDAADVVARKERALERLRPLFDHLDRHYAEPISIDHAAGLLGMSRSHFMRFFRSLTGQPLVAHVNRLRVAKAQQLLTRTDKPIAAVSQEVGFCDQSYFGLVFRRLVGMTPREYAAAAARLDEAATLGERGSEARARKRERA